MVFIKSLDEFGFTESLGEEFDCIFDDNECIGRLPEEYLAEIFQSEKAQI